MQDNKRRDFIKKGALATTVLIGASSMALANQNKAILDTSWDKTFAKDSSVEHKKISFKNRYGITVVADLYLPKNRTNKKYKALVLSGPFGAVKEQVSGLYAQTLASKGFVTLAFDPSFTGESGGEVRNVASAEIFTEDFSAAVDYLTLQSFVDSNKIGAVGICGLSGMALTAASADTRIKAIATASMYDMSRSIAKGYKDSYTKEQKLKVIEYLSEQRTIDAKNGKFALGYHEVPFDDKGDIVKGNRVLPETLMPNPNLVLKEFFDYYRTKRGFHNRSINSTTAWTATTPVSFFQFPMYDNLELISPRPILLIAGDNAHSRYYSQDVYNQANSPKELLIVENATHVDLYDNLEKIPFNKIAEFFENSLK